MPTFHDVPVFTNTRLAACFGVDRATLRGNTALQPHRFKPGVHFYKLGGKELRNFMLCNMHTGEVARRCCSSLIIWSLEGAEAHAAMFPPAIANRGRRAMAAYLRGEAPATAAADEDDEQPATILPAQPLAVTLTFPHPAALGQALPELLALTQRHGVQLTVAGSAA